MRLVYISGLYLPAFGGAEISIYTTLRILSEIPIEIHVITGLNRTSFNSDDRKDKNITVHRLEGASEIESTLDHIIRKYGEVDGLITQNMWSDKAIKIGRKKSIPIIFFLRSAFGQLDVSPTGEYACDFILANSDTTKTYLEDKWRLQDIKVVPPMVDFRDYITEKNNLRYITMVNPITIKGGLIFKQIAQSLPEYEFLAVKGWSHLKNSETWDTEKLQDLADSFKADFWIPTEVNLTNTPNITVLPSTMNMREIYEQTRLLLIPSTVMEASPRVALEAMINGIPVIGSNIGGIPTAVGTGGDTVQDYENLASWIDIIKRYDDNAYYQAKSLNAVKQASKESNTVKIQPLLDIIRSLKNSR